MAKTQTRAQLRFQDFLLTAEYFEDYEYIKPEQREQDQRLLAALLYGIKRRPNDTQQWHGSNHSSPIFLQRVHKLVSFFIVYSPHKNSGKNSPAS